MNINEIISNALSEVKNPPMKLVGKVNISSEMKYHLENNISLNENIFRIYSTKYFDMINEARDLYNNNLLRLNDNDIWLVESDLGKKVILENGDEVWLDAPIYTDNLEDVLTEAIHRGKNVKLGSPFRTPGGPKKFAVYVKTPKGTVKKVTFGDPNLRIKNANKGRAK